MKLEIYDTERLPPAELCTQIAALQRKRLLENLPPSSAEGFLYTCYSKDELHDKLARDQGRLYANIEQGRLMSFALTTRLERFEAYCNDSRWESVQERILPGYRYLEQIAVDPAHKGQRLGAALLRMIFEREPRLVTDLSLQPKLNRQALRFFTLQDFEQLGEMHDLTYRGQKLSFEARRKERPSTVDHRRTLSWVILTALCAVVSFTAFERFLARPGLLTGALELSLWLAMAILSWRRRATLFPQFSKSLPALWSGGTIALFFADFIYFVRYYALKISSPSGAVPAITSALYGLGFLLIASALWRQSETKRPSLKSLGSLVIPAGLASFAFALLAHPLMTSAAAGALAPIMDLFSLASSYALFIVASYLNICTASPFWTLALSGISTLLLGDWAIKYEKFYQASVSYQIFESIWLLGVLLLAGCLIVARDFLPNFRRYGLFEDIQRRKELSFSLVLSFGVLAPIALQLTPTAFRDWIVIIAICPLALAFLYSLHHRPKHSVLPDLLTEKMAFLAQEQSLRDQELRIEKAKGDLLDRLIHDIRSPLAALKIIRPQIVPNIEPTARLLLTSSVDRIESLTNDLASISLKAKPAAKPDDSFHLLSILEAVVLEKKALEATQRLEIQLHSSSDAEGIFISGSHGELARAISNLLNNAIEAVSATNGRIGVKAGRAPKAKLAFIEIEDNGPGLPEKIRMQFGEKGATSGKDSLSESGSGIGIYSSKQAVESLGGQLSLDESHPSRLRLELPIAAVPDYLAEKISLQGIERVFAIDDDPSVIHTLRALVPPGREFKAWLSPSKITEAEADPRNSLLLLDWIFPEESVNIDQLSRHFSGFKNVYLVTSEFSRAEVITAARRHRLAIVPKRWLLSALSTDS